MSSQVKGELRVEPDVDASTEAGDSQRLSTVSSRSSCSDTDDPDFTHDDVIDLIRRLWPRQNAKKPRFRLRMLWSGGRKARDRRKPKEPTRPPPGSVEKPERTQAGRDRVDCERSLECKVAVNDLKYSQRTCGDVFSCGRPCLDLVRDLRAGKVDPLTASFLTLDVIQKRDRRGRLALYSTDNRRLWCLKKFQRFTNGQVKVRVRMLPEEYYNMFVRFSRNLDTDTDGRHIRVREGAKPKRSTWLHEPVRAPKRRRTGGY